MKDFDTLTTQNNAEIAQTLKELQAAQSRFLHVSKTYLEKWFGDRAAQTVSDKYDVTQKLGERLKKMKGEVAQLSATAGDAVESNFRKKGWWVDDATKADGLDNQFRNFAELELLQTVDNCRAELAKIFVNYQYWPENVRGSEHIMFSSDRFPTEVTAAATLFSQTVSRARGLLSQRRDIEREKKQEQAKQSWESA